MDMELILKLLKVLCPYLKKMAGDTKNPIDDLIVNIICTLVGVDDKDASS